MSWRVPTDMRFGFEKLLVGLIVLTLLAIVGERKILETHLIVDGRSGLVSVYSDMSEGGNSRAEVLDDKNLIWMCDIQLGHQWPHCGFELIFDAARQRGVDLRQYDRVRIWLDYEGPTESLRIYLRNYDPAYSRPGPNDSTKFNQVEFDSSLARKSEPLEFAMKDFFVANWWLQRYRLPPRQGHPQFDNIVIFEVQTGVYITPGEHRFRLERVEFTGQVLSTEEWYRLLLSSWLGLALVFLAVRTLYLKKELRRKSQRERELTEINSLLDSRSQDLEEKVRTDPLTGAFNRQGLEEAMKISLTEWRQEGKPFSIVMLDLDHFKAINDTYGHAEGDRVLGAVSDLIRAKIRPTDVFARWGGEEFVLVCRNTALQEAILVAEKLRKGIQEYRLGSEGSVSASFGVATIQAGETLDQIFNRVDSALYRAKHTGRNRVEPPPAVA